MEEVVVGGCIRFIFLFVQITSAAYRALCEAGYGG